ncbi:MAG: DUF4390 domain-containing protein [Candidatus Neomarinimicrobiota bacterium]
MDSTFFSILSKKIITSVISVGSIFYSTITGVNASFSSLELSAKGDNIIISATLENCFSPELDQILRSGLEIKINFLAELLDQENQKIVRDTIFYHSLKYSVLEDDYGVFTSENQNYYNQLTLAQSKLILSKIEKFQIIKIENLNQNINYRIKLTAWLDKIEIRSRDEPLNLMFYWKSIKPTGLTTSFSKAEFAQ